MSDIESESRSPSPVDKSFFDKEGSAKRSASRSRSRSRKRFSRSRSRSPGMSTSRRRYYSKSRSRSPYNRRHKKSRYRSRSRSYSPRSSRRSHDRYRHSYRSRSRSPMSSRRRHTGTRENPRTSNCVGVFGLSLYTQERDLRDAFGRYGPIDDIQVVYDHQTGRSRGFAFIYYKNLEDAEDAKERAPGTEIDGRKIRVDYSITERAHTPTPGIYLGKPTPRGDYRHRRSPSPYYYRSSRRGYSRSRSRSRSYSPRKYWSRY